MRHRNSGVCVCAPLIAVVMTVFVCSPALAQSGATSSLIGTVVDAGGGIVPGASIVIKDNATGTTYEATSNTSGAFSVPALDPATYTVTVSLTGFKTAVVNDVRLLAARPSEIKVVLE